MPAILAHTENRSDTGATHLAREQFVPAQAQPMIIASDGSQSAALAMRAGRVLSDAKAAPIQVLSVLEPVSALAPAPLLVGLPSNVDELRDRRP